MAVIDFTKVEHPWGDRARLFTWEGLTAGDTGKPVVIPEAADVTVLIDFNSGGQTLELQGHLSPDAVIADFIVLADPQGNAISKTGATNVVEAVLENVLQYAPVCSGSGGDVDVYLLAKRT